MQKGDLVILTEHKQLRFLPVGYLAYADVTDMVLGAISELAPDMLDCIVEPYDLPYSIGIICQDYLTVRDIAVRYGWFDRWNGIKNINTKQDDLPVGLEVGVRVQQVLEKTMEVNNG